MIRCRDAFEFYLSVFGRKFVSFLASTDTPPDMPVSDAEKYLVMHVVLPIGSGTLMGSDKSDSGPPIVVGNNFSFAFQAECREQCDKPFAKRSEGLTPHAAVGDVLGRVLRNMDRPIRHQLDGKLRFAY